ncbi:ATP synthase subunit s, mitochondrial-like isoform X1 [Gigantopelta aegis]|uniref:ATP synthase subunit s, mitochondrial-like isoform X1 n=1 Tax=Gigantopelta aegis TaxID=1735272 RepID=UPI001B88B06F|nr:ATP synthase subunit s, mitochondrial-like isoform X1 [Gigantopelta aegis]
MTQEPKQIYNYCLGTKGNLISHNVKITKRFLWGYLNSVFNRVDEDRLKQVGPDRACAEWLLRCGASIKWKGLNHFEKDYNSLPGSNFDKYKIEEIDASKSAVMGIGFPHLNGLKHVRKIILHDCNYLYDDALSYLPLVKETLNSLQISSCGDISDEGLAHVCQLSNLKVLLMYDLPEVRNKSTVLKKLQGSLPKCNIDYFDATREK